MIYCHPKLYPGTIGQLETSPLGSTIGRETDCCCRAVLCSMYVCVCVLCGLCVAVCGCVWLCVAVWPCGCVLSVVCSPCYCYGSDDAAGAWQSRSGLHRLHGVHGLRGLRGLRALHSGRPSPGRCHGEHERILRCWKLELLGWIDGPCLHSWDSI